MGNTIKVTQVGDRLGNATIYTNRIKMAFKDQSIKYAIQLVRTDRFGLSIHIFENVLTPQKLRTLLLYIRDFRDGRTAEGYFPSKMPVNVVMI